MDGRGRAAPTFSGRQVPLAMGEVRVGGSGRPVPTVFTSKNVLTASQEARVSLEPHPRSPFHRKEDLAKMTVRVSTGGSGKGYHVRKTDASLAHSVQTSRSQLNGATSTVAEPISASRDDAAQVSPVAGKSLRTEAQTSNKSRGSVQPVVEGTLQTRVRKNETTFHDDAKSESPDKVQEVPARNRESLALPATGPGAGIFVSSIPSLTKLHSSFTARELALFTRRLDKDNATQPSQTQALYHVASHPQATTTAVSEVNKQAVVQTTAMMSDNKIEQPVSAPVPQRKQKNSQAPSEAVHTEATWKRVDTSIDHGIHEDHSIDMVRLQLLHGHQSTVGQKKRKMVERKRVLAAASGLREQENKEKRHQEELQQRKMRIQQMSEAIRLENKRMAMKSRASGAGRHEQHTRATYQTPSLPQRKPPVPRLSGKTVTAKTLRTKRKRKANDGVGGVSASILMGPSSESKLQVENDFEELAPAAQANEEKIDVSLDSSISKRKPTAGTITPRVPKRKKKQSTINDLAEDSAAVQAKEARRAIAREYMQLQKHSRRIWSAKMKEQSQRQQDKRQQQLEILEATRLKNLRLSKKRSRVQKKQQVPDEDNMDVDRSIMNDDESAAGGVLAKREPVVDTHTKKTHTPDDCSDLIFEASQVDNENNRAMSNTASSSDPFTHSTEIYSIPAIRTPANNKPPVQQPNPVIDDRVQKLLELREKAAALSNRLNGLRNQQVKRGSDVNSATSLTVSSSNVVSTSPGAGEETQSRNKAHDGCKLPESDMETNNALMESTYSDESGENDGGAYYEGSDHSSVGGRSFEGGKTSTENDLVENPTQGVGQVESEEEITSSTQTSQQLARNALEFASIASLNAFEVHHNSNSTVEFQNVSSPSLHFDQEEVMSDSEEVFKASVFEEMKNDELSSSGEEGNDIDAGEVNGYHEDSEESMEGSYDSGFSPLRDRLQSNYMSKPTAVHDDREQPGEGLQRLLRETDDSLSVIDRVARNLYRKQRDDYERAQEKELQERIEMEKQELLKKDLALEAVMASLRSKGSSGLDGIRSDSNDDESDEDNEEDKDKLSSLQYKRLEEIMDEVEKERALEKQAVNDTDDSIYDDEGSPGRRHSSLQMNDAETSVTTPVPAFRKELTIEVDSDDAVSKRHHVSIDDSELVAQREACLREEDDQAASLTGSPPRMHSPRSLSRRLMAAVDYQEAIFEAHLQLSMMEHAHELETVQAETITLAQAFKEEMDNNAMAHQLALDHSILEKKFDSDMQDVMHQLEEIRQAEERERLEKEAENVEALKQAQIRESSTQTALAQQVDAATNAALCVETSTSPVRFTVDASIQHDVKKDLSVRDSGAQTAVVQQADAATNAALFVETSTSPVRFTVDAAMQHDVGKDLSVRDSSAQTAVVQQIDVATNAALLVETSTSPVRCTVDAAIQHDMDDLDSGQQHLVGQHDATTLRNDNSQFESASKTSSVAASSKNDAPKELAVVGDEEEEESYDNEFDNISETAAEDTSQVGSISESTPVEMEEEEAEESYNNEFDSISESVAKDPSLDVDISENTPVEMNSPAIEEEEESYDNEFDSISETAVEDTSLAASISESTPAEMDPSVVEEGEEEENYDDEFDSISESAAADTSLAASISENTPIEMVPPVIEEEEAEKNYDNEFDSISEPAALAISPGEDISESTPVEMDPPTVEEEEEEENYDNEFDSISESAAADTSPEADISESTPVEMDLPVAEEAENVEESYDNEFDSISESATPDTSPEADISESAAVEIDVHVAEEDAEESYDNDFDSISEAPAPNASLGVEISESAPVEMELPMDAEESYANNFDSISETAASDTDVGKRTPLDVDPTVVEEDEDDESYGNEIDSISEMAAPDADVSEITHVETAAPDTDIGGSTRIEEDPLIEASDAQSNERGADDVLDTQEQHENDLNDVSVAVDEMDCPAQETNGGSILDDIQALTTSISLSHDEQEESLTKSLEERISRLQALKQRIIDRKADLQVVQKKMKKEQRKEQLASEEKTLWDELESVERLLHADEAALALHRQRNRLVQMDLEARERKHSLKMPKNIAIAKPLPDLLHDFDYVEEAQVNGRRQQPRASHPDLLNKKCRSIDQFDLLEGYSYVEAAEPAEVLEEKVQTNQSASQPALASVSSVEIQPSTIDLLDGYSFVEAADAALILLPTATQDIPSASFTAIQLNLDPPPTQEPEGMDFMEIDDASFGGSRTSREPSNVSSDGDVINEQEESVDQQALDPVGNTNMTDYDRQDLSTKDLPEHEIIDQQQDGDEKVCTPDPSTTETRDAANSTTHQPDRHIQGSVSADNSEESDHESNVTSKEDSAAFSEETKHRVKEAAERVADDIFSVVFDDVVSSELELWSHPPAGLAIYGNEQDPQEDNAALSHDRDNHVEKEEALERVADDIFSVLFDDVVSSELDLWSVRSTGLMNYHKSQDLSTNEPTFSQQIVDRLEIIENEIFLPPLNAMGLKDDESSTTRSVYDTAVEIAAEYLHVLQQSVPSTASPSVLAAIRRHVQREMDDLFAIRQQGERELERQLQLLSDAAEDGITSDVLLAYNCAPSNVASLVSKTQTQLTRTTDAVSSPPHLLPRTPTSRAKATSVLSSLQTQQDEQLQQRITSMILYDLLHDL